MRLSKFWLGLVLLCWVSSVSAHNKVVVIPLGGSEAEFKPLQNVVTVAKSEGDFTDIQAAIDSISNATPTTPYLVVIGPGTYSVTSPIIAKENVHITGSGRDATIISANVSGSTFDTGAAVLLVNNVRLSDLSIVNTATSSALAIGVSVFSPATLQDNIFIENIAIRITAQPSGSARGIYIENGMVDIFNTDVLVDGTAVNNYGIRVYTGNVKIRNSNVDVMNGVARNLAVYTRVEGVAEIAHSTLFASGADATALYGPGTVKYSTLNGATYSIYRTAGIANSYWSTLTGPLSDTSGSTIKCFYSLNGDNASLLGLTCSPISQ